MRGKRPAFSPAPRYTMWQTQSAEMRRWERERSTTVTRGERFAAMARPGAVRKAGNIRWGTKTCSTSKTLWLGENSFTRCSFCVCVSPEDQHKYIKDVVRTFTNIAERKQGERNRLLPITQNENVIKVVYPFLYWHIFTALFGDAVQRIDKVILDTIPFEILRRALGTSQLSMKLS